MGKLSTKQEFKTGKRINGVKNGWIKAICGSEVWLGSNTPQMYFMCNCLHIGKWHVPPLPLEMTMQYIPGGLWSKLTGRNSLMRIQTRFLFSMPLIWRRRKITPKRSVLEKFCLRQELQTSVGGGRVSESQVTIFFTLGGLMSYTRDT